MTSPNDRAAHVVGLGLIGGSVALALGAAGWRVTGDDDRPGVTEDAIAHGVVVDCRPVSGASLFVVAVPAPAVVPVGAALMARAGRDAIVTDVCGVKGSITRAISDPRFIGGHPMAGSELRGLAGARADLFSGCTWVLTPTPSTDPSKYATLHGHLRELGANVMALDGDTHDRLVALASHVPHLVAGALMNAAAEAAQSEGALLQLAAGGFRDMTRVAAGDPDIWPDLLIENSHAVTAGLRQLTARLDAIADGLALGDRDQLLAVLRSATAARRRLPGRAVHPEDLSRLRVPVPDEPGVLARVTTTASDHGVNIYDIEIVHSVEGQPGVLLLTVAADTAGVLAAALLTDGFTVTRDEVS